MTDLQRSKWNWRKTAVILPPLFYALLNAWRAVGIRQQAAVLDAFNPTIGTQVRFYIAVGWAAVFTMLLVSAWRKRPISKVAIPTAILIYALYRFGLITQFAQSPYMQQSVTIFTFLHILIALLVFITNRHYK